MNILIPSLDGDINVDLRNVTKVAPCLVKENNQYFANGSVIYFDINNQTLEEHNFTSRLFVNDIREIIKAAGFPIKDILFENDI